MLTSRWSTIRECDIVLFVERANELWYVARLRSWSFGAEGKPSLKRAIKLRAIDPKPGDLSMGRLKLR